jgi:hypothetical protein
VGEVGNAQFCVFSACFGQAYDAGQCRFCVSRADLIFEYEWRPIQVTWHQSDVGFTAEQVKVCWNSFRAHIIR